MSENTSNTAKPIGPTVLYGLGILLVLAAIVKASVIGYYDSDLPWLAALFIGGGLSVFIAKRLGERG